MTSESTTFVRSCLEQGTAELFRAGAEGGGIHDSGLNCLDISLTECLRPRCTVIQVSASAQSHRPSHSVLARPVIGVGTFIVTLIALIGAAAISVAPIHDGAAPIELPVTVSTPTAPGGFLPQDRAAHWSLAHGYARSGGHILFKGVRIDQAGQENLDALRVALGRPVVLAHDVDAESFAALSEEYAKDRNSVYYKWISPGEFWVVEMPGADPATFEVMDFNLAKDAHRVWRTDVPIEGADAATARVVNPGWVWKDRRTVYYQFTALDDVDPESFRHLNQAFYRDARQVYWSTTRLDGADVNTFRTFGNDIPYGADRQHVWFGDRRLPHVDAGSFRLLHNHIFADAERVYVGGRGLPVLDADAATFEKVAELASLDCVLFRDRSCDYLFDPAYGEVYTLTRTRDSETVTKPVWFGETVGPVRHAATVSASWTNGALSEPVISMQPGFEGSPKPNWEVGKLQRMIDAIREAMALLGEEPVAHKDELGASLEGRGDP